MLMLWLSLVVTVCDLQRPHSSSQSFAFPTTPHLEPFHRKLTEAAIISQGLPLTAKKQPLKNGTTNFLHPNGSTSSSFVGSITSPVNLLQNQLYIKKKGESSPVQEDRQLKGNDNGASEENLLFKLDRNYTPKEIADYIFRTGDERGISQAINEMIQDGQIMPSKDDVIRFLEVVQMELTLLRNQGKRFPFHNENRRKSSDGSSSYTH